MNKNKKLANMAMLVALAMIFSYVESLIPINFGIPGMKLGVGLQTVDFQDVLSGISGSISGCSYANPADRLFIWKWNVDRLQPGRRNLKLSGHGADEEAERIFRSRSQYRRRRVTQYRSDHCGISCGRESETDLLSSGTSDRRYSDRICDGNDK